MNGSPAILSTLSPRAEAEANQRAASNPAVSAFVAASAGSGKTRLLTDRLLRLMAGGARPERILCLTFTKAAATEMAVRLQRRLGEWVTLDAPMLESRLRDLAIEPTEATMVRARSLFAEVLDLPGGMRIGTIHGFCQSLLRRFPLEARLSPHFQLLDDRDAREAMTEARENLLTRTREHGFSPALQALAGLATLGRFGELVTKLKESRDRWRQCRAPGIDLAAARRRVLGVTAPDRATLISDAVRWPDEAAVRRAALDIQSHAHGAAQVTRKAGNVLDWLSLGPVTRAERWRDWRDLFLTKDSEPRGPTTFVNEKLLRARDDLLTVMLAEADRVRGVEDQARAIEVALISEALMQLAGPLLDRYESRKEATSLLEFDDLIGRSTDLLVDPGAAWVLYKLDGGLDHLLLDEVQDTAPEQWAIAHGLTQEFFAGQGARDTMRTVFAVGDLKQSIFSFQGADVAGFGHARETLRQRVTGAGQAWLDAGLNVSFRSTAPVLALVDAVFAHEDAAAGVVAMGETLLHRADRAGHAGRVELWPLAEPPETVEPPKAWTAPERNQGLTSARRLLAEELAEWIRGQTNGSVLLESKGRPLRPGDVMILVRRRDDFGRSLVRALKSLGVPVAGLDRMMLTEQPAVQDLMALADALLLPQDDLTFACVLTSPLGGLNDDDLMALAIGRTKPLWEVLRDRHREQPAWTAAWSFFSALLSRADYVSPYALFAEALGTLGGHARLLARLGAEAAEPVDELLNAALNYARLHPPSLQGFLHWLRRSGAEVKREAEAAGDQVRILTVHGAKGLQAPLVILPDTTGMPKDEDGLLWGADPLTGGPVPLWAPRKEFHCAGTRGIRDEARKRGREEYNRLLYVALTRAEDRLVVCGWKPDKTLNEACWYKMVARGFARLGEVEEGALARHDSPQTAPPDTEHAHPCLTGSASLPAFLGQPPPPEPARPLPLAPSRPLGVELGPLPMSVSPLARVEGGVNWFQRGQVIHALLQHLPALPQDRRHAAALGFLGRPCHGFTPGTAAGIAEEAMAILDHPALAPLFGPGSRAEVPLSGLVGDVIVGGQVDRLVVLPDRVLFGDFKTNRRPPASVRATPVAYLRQMASYRAVLRMIFPCLPVVCALVWTREAQVVMMPDALLDPYEPGR